MSPAELLDMAATAALRVFADGSQLVVRGPRNTDRDLVQVLLDRKAELMPELWREALHPELRLDFEERAAIAQFDGGLSPEEAVQQAWQQLYSDDMTSP